MFSGSVSAVVDVGETTICIRRKGNGRPLLLLHGFPQTHVMWHRTRSTGHRPKRIKTQGATSRAQCSSFGAQEVERLPMLQRARVALR
jgi:pimeloyl-ACP methyl ester carboxylesterase